MTSLLRFRKIVQRSLGRTARLLYPSLAVVVLAALTYGTVQAPVVHLTHVRNASFSYGLPYSVAETYGGTNPVDTCTGCDFWGKAQTGTTSPPTTQPSQLVNPLTGDVAESYTLFTQPDPGQNFGFTLNYDSIWGQTETLYDSYFGTGPEFYGYGWRSNLSTNVTGFGGSGPSTDTEFFVAQPSGALDTFYPQATCSTLSGVSTKTAPYSSANFCTADRVDGELGAYSNYSNYIFVGHGGRQVLTYDAFGRVVAEGSLQQPTYQTISWGNVPHQNGCPATIGGQVPSVCTTVWDNGNSPFRYYAVGWSGSGNTYNVMGVQDPSGASWPVTVNASGDLLGVTDPNGHSWNFTYDSGNGSPDQHDVNGIQDPNGNKTTLTYTPAGTNGGFVSSVTDPLGNATTYQGYNASDEQNGYTYAVTQTNPTGQTITYQVSANMLQLETVGNTSSDPNYSATTEYVYNGTDQQPQEIVTDPLGQTTTINTDEVGNVLQQTNSYGSTVATYNQFDEPCWKAPPGVSYPGGTFQSATCAGAPVVGQGATIYQYDSNGNPIETFDPTGVATETQYDANGYPCWQTMPGALQGSWPACSAPPSDSIRYQYNGNGLLVNSSTPDGASGSYAYDTTTYTYNSYGEVASMVSPNGNVTGGTPSNYTTNYYYDSAGRLYKVTAPMSRTTTATLDAMGNVVSVTDPAGQVTSAAYDQDERPCWVAQSAQTPSCQSTPTTSTRYVYHANTADPLSVTDPNGQMTFYSYLNPDAPDSPTTVTDPLGNITSKVYDKNARLCVSGTASTSLYSSGDPSCQWSSGYTYQTFDQLGNVLTSEDQSGRTTSYTRGDNAYPADATTVSPPSGGAAQPANYSYDSDGRLLQVHEGNGNYVSYAYNAASEKCWQAPVNNLSATCSTAVPVGGSSWGFYYSGLPLLMSDVISSSTTNLTLWAYDAQGQLTAKGNFATGVHYAYDYAGDNTCVAYPVSSGSTSCSSPASSTNTVVNYGYDADGRMTSMSDWLGNSFSFGYDTRSNLNSINYPSASHWVEVLGPYDAANNVTQLVFGSSTYGFIPLAYPVNHDEELASGVGVNYGYNSQNRVSSVGSDSLSYNANGELTTDSSGGTTLGFNYSAASEITSETSNGSTTETLAYDGNGNRCGVNFNSTQPNCSNPSVGSFEYGYNAFNELCYLSWVTASHPNPTCSSPPATALETYTYDGSGLRVSATSGSTTQNFTYDTQTRAGQPLIIEDGTNAYLYGPPNASLGSAPMEQISLSTGAVSYLLSTPSGVGTVTNSAGTITGQASYSVYGKQSGTISTPFGFQGDYTDGSDGLMYLINRYYDPGSGQFLTVDPAVQATGQRYAGFSDNPLNLTDPFGLSVGYCSPGDCPTEHGGNAVINFAGTGNPAGQRPPSAGTQGYSQSVIGVSATALVPASSSQLASIASSNPGAKAAVNDYVQTPKSFGSLCVNLIAVNQDCLTFTADGVYVSTGVGIGTPGVTGSYGITQGESINSAMTGWSTCVDGAFAWVVGLGHCWSNAVASGSTTFYEATLPSPIGGGVFTSYGWRWKVG